MLYKKQDSTNTNDDIYISGIAVAAATRTVSHRSHPAGPTGRHPHQERTSRHNNLDDETRALLHDAVKDKSGFELKM